MCGTSSPGDFLANYDQTVTTIAHEYKKSRATHDRVGIVSNPSLQFDVLNETNVNDRLPGIGQNYTRRKQCPPPHLFLHRIPANRHVMAPTIEDQPHPMDDILDHAHRMTPLVALDLQQKSST